MLVGPSQKLEGTKYVADLRVSKVVRKQTLPAGPMVVVKQLARFLPKRSNSTDIFGRLLCGPH